MAMVGENHQIKSVVLSNYGCIPWMIQKGEKIGTLSQHGNFYFNKDFTTYFYVPFINFDKQIQHLEKT